MFAVQNVASKRTHGWTTLPKAKRQKGLLKRITGGSTPNGQVPNLNTPPNTAPARRGPPLPGRRVSLEGNNVQRIVGVLASSPGSSPIRARNLEFGNVGPDSPPRTAPRVPYDARQAAIEATRQREAAQAAARARRREADERYFAQHGQNRDPRDQHSGSEEGFGKYGAHHLHLVHHLKGGSGNPLATRIERMRYFYGALTDPAATGWIDDAVSFNEYGAATANFDLINDNFDIDRFYELLEDAERLNEFIIQYYDYLPTDVKHESDMNWMPRLKILLPKLHFIFNLPGINPYSDEEGSFFGSDFEANSYHGSDPSDATNSSMMSTADGEIDPTGNDSDVTVPIGGSRIGGARDPRVPGAPARPPRLPEPDWRLAAQAQQAEHARQVAQEAAAWLDAARAQRQPVRPRNMLPYHKYNSLGGSMSGGAKRRLLNSEQYRTYAHVLYQHRKLISEIRPILESIFPNYPHLNEINALIQLAAVENSSFQWIQQVVDDSERLDQHHELFTVDELTPLFRELTTAANAYDIITDEGSIQNARNFMNNLRQVPVGPDNLSYVLLTN